MYFPKLYCYGFATLNLQAQTAIPIQPEQLTNDRIPAASLDLNLLAMKGKTLLPGSKE